MGYFWKSILEIQTKIKTKSKVDIVRMFVYYYTYLLRYKQFKFT